MAYLAAEGRDVSDMTCSAAYIETGDLSIWSLECTRMKGEVHLPDRVKIDIDGVTGALVTYMDLGRPYVDPPTPRLTRAAAIARVQDLKGGGGRNADAALTVMFSAYGQQLLVWQVTVDNGTGLGPQMFVLDDQTGTIATDVTS